MRGWFSWSEFTAQVIYLLKKTTEIKSLRLLGSKENKKSYSDGLESWRGESISQSINLFSQFSYFLKLILSTRNHDLCVFALTF